jgi:hypothetical protein
VRKPSLDRRTRRIAIGSSLSLGATLGIAASAQATDYTVDRTDDPAGAGSCVLAAPNDCSLRQALNDAQNGNRPAVDRVLFQSGLSGTITLTFAGLSVTEPVNVVGPGANVLAVSGGNFQRVLDTEQGTVGDPVTISGLTLTNGNGSGSVGGGAIYSKDTYLTIESSTISNSTGGGIGDEVGGGIHQVGDQLLIRNSTISGNHGGNGGGIDAFEADVGLVNSTISGNTATGTGSGSGYGYGGGIWLDKGAAGGSLVSYNSTISDNHAYDGGGITSNAAANANGLVSTVVADNTATAAPPHRDLRNAGPAPFNLAFSLVESTAGASIAEFPTYAGTNILGTDPQLGPLANNGGPTPTQKPSLTSPLLDRGKSVIRPFDQRGFARPFDIPSIANASAGDASDIGAVELQAADFAAPVAPAPAPTPTKKKCKKKKHKSSAQIAKKKCKKKK